MRNDLLFTLCEAAHRGWKRAAQVKAWKQLGINCPRIKLNWKLEGVLSWVCFYSRSEKEFMKETADSKERINIPRGLSEKTDGTKTSGKIKHPPGDFFRGKLGLNSQYGNTTTKKCGCLVMLSLFVLCPCCFSLLGVLAQQEAEDGQNILYPGKIGPQGVYSVSGGGGGVDGALLWQGSLFSSGWKTPICFQKIPSLLVSSLLLSAQVPHRMGWVLLQQFLLWRGRFPDVKEEDKSHMCSTTCFPSAPYPCSHSSNSRLFWPLSVPLCHVSPFNNRGQLPFSVHAV